MTSSEASSDMHAGDMRTIVLHGDELRYVDEGTGPVVVLIHGLLGSVHNWQPQIDTLSRRYRVIAPDLFGHGQSSKPRGDYSLSSHAATVRDLPNPPAETRRDSKNRAVRNIVSETPSARARASASAADRVSSTA